MVITQDFVFRSVIKGRQGINPAQDFFQHVATVSDFLTVVFSPTCNTPIASTAARVHFRFCIPGRDHGQKITDRGYGLKSILASEAPRVGKAHGQEGSVRGYVAGRG